MKSREVRYKVIYPKEEFLKVREAGSLSTGLGSLGVLSKSLQRKVNRLEKVCQNLEGKDGEKSGRCLPMVRQTELVKVLTQIIDDLPPREKTLFSLHYCEELNFKEIGEVLGSPELKVIRLFKDGMKKVAEKMRLKAAN